MVEEMEVAEVQRLGGIGKLERSEKTKKVNAKEEGLQSMRRARA